MVNEILVNELMIDLLEQGYCDDLYSYESLEEMFTNPYRGYGIIAGLEEGCIMGRAFEVILKEQLYREDW